MKSEHLLNRRVAEKAFFSTKTGGGEEVIKILGIRVQFELGLVLSDCGRIKKGTDAQS